MKQLFAEITHEERNRILEMHRKENRLISEQQLTQKQIEASNAGWGPVTDEYAKTLPVDSQGKIIPKTIDKSSQSSTSSKIKQTPSNQPQTLFDLVQSEKDKSGKNYRWKEVRAAWQKLHPEKKEGSAEQNNELRKAWIGGWRPDTNTQTTTSNTATNTQTSTTNGATNTQNNTTPQTNQNLSLDTTRGYKYFTQLGNSIQGKIGDPNINYSGGPLTDDGKKIITAYLDSMGYKVDRELASGPIFFVKK